MNLAANCLLGLEGLVAEELKIMGAEHVNAQNGRVYFQGGPEMMARANLCSRFAERILIVLGEFPAHSFEELFQGVKALPWPDYLGVQDAFPVKGYSIQSQLHSVPDCQSIIKKAVVERMKQAYAVNWFEETGAVHQIQFAILKDTVTVMLDTSGIPLHKRGYRPDANEAPIRETLAAAMAQLARLRHYHTLCDPFCGSGTILIEGAMLAANVMPGRKRNFAAQRWEQFERAIWKDELERANSLVKTDIEFRAFGADLDGRAVELAGVNAKRAGVDRFLTLERADFAAFAPESGKGTVICNPPYGERMLEEKEARRLVRMMGERFVRKRGWSYHIISPSETFEQDFGRPADKRRKLYNGMIKCQLFMYYK